MKVKRFFSGVKKSPIDDVRDLMCNTILAHVPVENYDYKMKAIFLALMIRRVIEVQENPKLIDDKYVIVAL